MQSPSSKMSVASTGFDPGEEASDRKVIRPNFRRGVATRPLSRGPARLPRRMPLRAAVGDESAPGCEAQPFHRPPERVVDRSHLGDLDIPTFIRRQMD